MTDSVALSALRQLIVPVVSWFLRLPWAQDWTKGTLVTEQPSIVEALRDASVSARLEGLGLTVIADQPDAFGATIAKDSARMENIVKRAKTKISN